MDIDVLVKVASFIGGALATTRLLYQTFIEKRGRTREDYKFAKEFLDSIEKEPDMHPFVKEKGYQSIAGTNQLETNEIEYLLTLKNSDRALKDYVLGKPYLEHLPHVGNLQIGFKDKYKGSWSRSWRKGMYGTLYIVLCLAIFAPLIFSGQLFSKPSNVLIGFTMSFMVCGPYAWLSLKAGSRIFRAEKLVQHQDRHTQRILLSETQQSIKRITTIKR